MGQDLEKLFDAGVAAGSESKAGEARPAAPPIASTGFNSCSVDRVTSIARWHFECTGPGAQSPHSALAHEGQSQVLLTGLAEGLHSLAVRAADIVGHVEADARMIALLLTASPTTTAVVASVSSPTNRTALVVSMVGQDTMTHIVGWRVTVSGRTPQFVSTNSLAVRDIVTEGLYVAVAQAVDRAGNEESRGALLQWTIDLTPLSTTE